MRDVPFFRVILLVSDSQEIQKFVELLTGLQRKLYFYILALVQNSADADDVLQETNRVIWEKSSDYEPETNFEAWAMKIAYFKVGAFRKKQHRQRLCFSDALVEQLSAEAVGRADQVDKELWALRGCMETLRDSDRDMLTRWHLAGSTTKEVAQHFARSEKSIYQSLARIRSWLMSCIERTLASEGR